MLAGFDLVLQGNTTAQGLQLEASPLASVPCHPLWLDALAVLARRTEAGNAIDGAWTQLLRAGCCLVPSSPAVHDTNA